MTESIATSSIFLNLIYYFSSQSYIIYEIFNTGRFHLQKCENVINDAATFTVLRLDRA